VAYQFVTKCINCAKEFEVLWVMDSTRIGPKTVARITCPLCRKDSTKMPKTFFQSGLR
jgi:hypothetical protein